MKRHDLIDIMLELLNEVVEENLIYAEEQEVQVELTTNTSLIGGEAVITSLNMVSFITDVEAMLNEDWDIAIIIVDERALSRTQSPFQTIETLADFILERIDEKSDSI